MRPALRRLWLALHRWLGLTLGAALALVALTGASLIVLKPLDERLHPELFAAPAATAGPASLDAIRQSLVARFGAQASFILRPPREAGETFWAYVHGPWDGVAYLDPATASILGTRGEREGVVPLLYEVHSNLLLGDAGRPVLAALALAYLVLLASGLALWWPRDWRRAWRVERRTGAARLLVDLHKVGGSLLGLLLAVSVASGAWMAWKPLSAFVTALAGQTALPVPQAGPVAGPAASLDAMVRQALAAYPGARVGYVQLPGATQPVRVRLKLPDDPHPNGLTSVWFHPATGAPLAARRWSDNELGARLTSTVYPLHTGTLGGPLHEALNALLGLALFGLGVSGAWLWWRRDRLRRSQAPAKGHSQGVRSCL